VKKTEAIFAIVREARAERGSNTAATRTARALRVLGLNDSEVIQVLHYFDYCKEDGTPYHEKIKRTW
jgi:hypothetical protein